MPQMAPIAWMWMLMSIILIMTITNSKIFNILSASLKSTPRYLKTLTTTKNKWMW